MTTPLYGNTTFHCIIPLHNSSHFPLQLVSFSHLQTLNKSISLRFIFIDDGSEKEYRSIYKKELILFGEKHDTVYLDLGEKPYPLCNRVNRARNIGAQDISNGFLVFFDQDTIPSANYFKEVLTHLKESDILIGPSLGYNNQEKQINNNIVDTFIRSGEFSDKNSYKDFRTEYVEDKARMGRLWEFFGASNIIIPASIFKKTWGFDETLTGWGDEDVEFGYRIHCLWYKMTFCQDIPVLNLSEKLYQYPYSFLENSKIRVLTEQFAKNYKKHPTPEYKQYILDRFSHFSLVDKKQVSLDFEKQILFHRFYSSLNDTVCLFRIDDITELSKDFLKIMQLFSHFQIPCTLAIEPGNISREMINYLLREKKKDSFTFDIIQHGWNHTNHSSGPWEYEFGEERSYEEKHTDIVRGHSRMKELFGRDFFGAFVPPYNFMDHESQEILKDLGFKLYSSGFPCPDFLPSTPIVSLPALIDIIQSYRPLRYKTLREILAEIDYYGNRDGYVSCMIHPQYFSSETVALLGKVLAYIKKKGFVALRFSDFYSQFSFDTHGT